MLIPCPTCSPCADVTIPTTGYESETPDVDLFIAYNYGVPGIVPPLNQPFFQWPCAVFCEAPTLEQAQQCAEVAQIQCLSTPPNECQLPPGGEVFLNNPQSCSLECPDGLPFVFTVPRGTYAAFTQAQADAMAASFACEQVYSAKVCLGNLPNSACIGGQFSGTVAATGVGPYRFAVLAGSLPPGLGFNIIDSFHFSVTGTPTTAGTYTFTVEAVDTRENFISKVYSISVIGITSSHTLPQAQNNQAYTFQFTESGAANPLWLVVSGALPPGLSLDPNLGILSGTPTQVGNYSFGVEISSQGVSCVQQCSLSVVGAVLWTPAVIPPLHWYAADKITGFTNGQNMYSWPDLGSGNNAFGENTNPGSSPFYLTNQLNGLPAVSFQEPSVTNLLLQNTGATPGVNSTLNPSWDGFSQANIFIVLQPTSVFNGQIIMQVFTTSGLQPGLLQLNLNTGGLDYSMSVRTHSTDGSTQINGTIAPTGGYDILAAQILYTAAQASLRINGSQSFSGQGFASAGTTSGSTATQLPGDSFFDSPENIAELIIDTINQPLSIIEKYEGYLSWKYGLQNNLPSNHPYRNNPPTV